MTADPHAPGLLSLEQWCALGEDTSARAELQEGVLIVSQRPRLDHQNAILRLGSALLAQVPTGLVVTPEPEVVIDPNTPATVRVPDLAVHRGGDAARLSAAEVSVIIEILSPGTRRVDLVLKRSEYAEAGIPHYWIVDLDSRRLELLELRDHHYVGDWHRGSVAVTAPFPIDVSIDNL